MEYEPGQCIDGQRVERRMAGGWADVYEVADANGGVAALKML